MAKTEPDGVYTVVGILEGTYSMQVRAPGYVGGQRRIEVTGREGEGFDISLLAGGSISGTVADGKRRPVVGASVFLSLSPTVTNAGRDRAATVPRVLEIVTQSNADGSFVLEGVPPWDAYMITATHLDHALARIDGIALGANEAIDGVDFTLARGGTIRGQVTDEAGRGLGGIDVRYAFEHAMDDGRTILLTTLEDRSVEGNDSREVFITRGDGSFTIPRLPEGTYTLAAEARNRLPTIRQGVEVREGRETRELHLVVRPGETLAGRVVDDEGLPIVGAIVLSERPTNCMCVQIPADLTDDEGRFRLRGLAPGSQALTVNKAGFMTVKTEVDVPASETVVISLQAAGRASGLVRAPVDVDYNAVRVHVVELTGEWGGKPFARGEPVRPDTGGEFFVDLAPGSYWLVARAPGFAPGRSVVFTISVGEELAGVDIPFVTGGTRAGVVLSGESGRGVEGVRIRLEPADGSRWTLPETTTDAAGRFVFGNVAVGHYRLVAEISPRARTILNVTMVEGANPELEIVVAASRKEESRQQQAQE